VYLLENKALWDFAGCVFTTSIFYRQDAENAKKNLKNLARLASWRLVFTLTTPIPKESKIKNGE
jgi:hypothetical protein